MKRNYIGGFDPLTSYGEDATVPVISALTFDEDGANGGGVVLCATQECAQPALFIAPPRYRIHSRQKQHRDLARLAWPSVVRISFQRF